MLLAQGQQHSERLIEREFQRVEALVHRDLSGYPSLQRDLKEQITHIDEDYVQSGEVPPKPPEWLKAVETVSQIPDNGSPVVAKILNDIHGTLRKSLDKNMQEYRRANSDRHGLLKKMMPYWRSLTNTLTSVERKITGLEQRSIIIDSQMQTYEEIRNKSDYAERMLSSSSMTQFFISGLALCLAIVGMYFNFQLVALPMQEMVGAASYLEGTSILASDVATLFIISIEIILGLFLMESIGVTQLFPMINLLEEHKRKIIFWVMLSFLLIFASMEASLAYISDMLVSDREALNKLLNDAVVVDPPLRWVPALGQMVMGFTLPIVLIFVAIPLESFIHSFRTVSGLFIAWVLHMLVVVIRFVANFIYGMGRTLVSAYDLVIFIPLKVEGSVKQTAPAKRERVQEQKQKKKKVQEQEQKKVQQQEQKQEPSLLPESE